LKNMLNVVKHLLRNQDGAASVGGMILVGISFIGLVVIIIMFPILLSATTTITDTVNDTNFTGFFSVVKLTPLLAWVGAVVMTIVTGYLGVKKMKG
jgi:hypothetical protein